MREEAGPSSCQRWRRIVGANRSQRLNEGSGFALLDIAQKAKRQVEVFIRSPRDASIGHCGFQAGLSNGKLPSHVLRHWQRDKEPGEARNCAGRFHSREGFAPCRDQKAVPLFPRKFESVSRGRVSNAIWLNRTNHRDNPGGML